MSYSEVETENKIVESVGESAVDAGALPENVESVPARSAEAVEITCEPLAASLREALQLSLESLRVLREEITHKIEFAWSREAALEKRIGQLMRDTGTPEENRKSGLGESVAMYTALLKGVIAEIDGELTFFTPFVGAEHPAVVRVPEGAVAKGSGIFFENSVRLLKSQAKNIRKYLAVSYSRYMYGFELQERNLEELEYKIAFAAQYRQMQAQRSS